MVLRNLRVLVLVRGERTAPSRQPSPAYRGRGDRARVRHVPQGFRVEEGAAPARNFLRQTVAAPRTLINCSMPCMLVALVVVEVMKSSCVV